MGRRGGEGEREQRGVEGEVGQWWLMKVPLLLGDVTGGGEVAARAREGDTSPRARKGGSENLPLFLPH